MEVIHLYLELLNMVSYVALLFCLNVAGAKAEFESLVQRTVDEKLWTEALGHAQAISEWYKDHQAKAAGTTQPRSVVHTVDDRIAHSSSSHRSLSHIQNVW